MSAELCRKLGYQFNDQSLLTLALTHRSHSDANNERLEFLGDSIINMVIADAIYLQFPYAREGDLSRFRASLVSRDALTELGREFELYRYLILGPGELRSGGNQRASIISCAMEAVIGAIYLDSGFAAVRDCILRWCQSQLIALKDIENSKDPKTQLQEYLQSKHMALPIYEVTSVEGDAHQQLFKVTCTVLALKQTVSGSGTSRRRAEQDAAETMLGKIKS